MLRYFHRLLLLQFDEFLFREYHLLHKRLVLCFHLFICFNISAFFYIPRFFENLITDPFQCK